MANTVISPNMSLPVPVVGTDPGPDWANNLNNCLVILDAHNHSSGSGVQINPNGININADLSMNQNNLTLIESLQYVSLSADVAVNNTGYVKNGNLYFTDGSGNNIQFTSGGSIVGATGNIIGLGGGAAVTYTNPTTKFTFTDNNTRPAALDSGALIIRETDAASPNAITLQSPIALSGNYSLVLFTALPGTTQAVNLDSSGNLGSITYDNIGLAFNASTANSIINTASNLGSSNDGTGNHTMTTSYQDMATVSIPDAGRYLIFATGQFQFNDFGGGPVVTASMNCMITDSANTDLNPNVVGTASFQTASDTQIAVTLPITLIAYKTFSGSDTAKLRAKYINGTTPTSSNAVIWYVRLA